MRSKRLILITAILVSIYISAVLGQNDIVGKWNWCDGNINEFKPGGVAEGPQATGTWTKIGGQMYDISWSNGYKDKLILSADGQSLYGRNQYDKADRKFGERISGPGSSCKLQVNGQGLHPKDSRIFIVSGIYSGITQTMLRINYVTDTGITGQSPSVLAEPNTIYSIETMPVLTSDTSRIDYKIEYMDAQGNWQTCGGDHTFQESYR
jgi:hypothetical protein